MTHTLRRTRFLLQQLANDGKFLTGCQAYVRLGDWEDAFEIGAGAPGKPMSGSTLWRLACASKPLVAIAIATLAESGRVSLDDHVSDYVYEFRGGIKDDITVRHLLNHTALLDRPRGMDLMFMSLDRETRHQRICNLKLRDNLTPGTRARYSEYSAWHLLGYVIERVSNAPLRQYLIERVIEPIGMNSTLFSMSRQEFLRFRDRLGLRFDKTRGRSIPFLIDLTQETCTRWDPTYSWYGTAKDLGLFYLNMLRSLKGDNGSILGTQMAHRFLQTNRGKMFDPTWNIFCDYGLGVARDLKLFNYGKYPSDRAFGHTGFWGSVVAFADPEHDLVISLIFNSLVDYKAPSASFTSKQITYQSRVAGIELPESRAEIVNCIYEELNCV